VPCAHVSLGAASVGTPSAAVHCSKQQPQPDAAAASNGTNGQQEHPECERICTSKTTRQDLEPDVMEATVCASPSPTKEAKGSAPAAAAAASAGLDCYPSPQSEVRVADMEHVYK
jgi:hypothetical protein